MKFSLRWLSHYIDLTVPVPQLLDRLTLAGTEVERVAVTGIDSPHIVVAQILSSVPHPNADRLSVCQVNDGTGTRQIVCGAKNYKVNDKVPLALPGAKLPGFTIKESKLRGELSQGMLCSAKELALAEDAEGLLLLPADAPIGKVFSEYQPGDTMFEVEITSNRPDLLSYRGMAREIASIGAGTLKVLPTAVIPFPEDQPTFKAVLNAPELGPYYTATHLCNVKGGPSPKWLQDAIEATGHRPINNVVDITNYVLFETGQPLHAFDAAKLAGHSIEVRRAKAGEKLEALDDKTYVLLPDDLVIADVSGPIALAGVMGGKPTGVTETTTEVVLEAAWFLPATVRRTSKRLGITSDSSYRYERRVDPGALLAARDRALTLLIELTGATISSASSIAGAPPAGRGPIALRSSRVKSLLGVDIPTATVEGNLTRLGCKKLSTISSESESVWQPPTFRDDLHREVDLIEEIARIHGLDDVPSRVTTGLHPETDADRAHQRLLRLRHALATRGWDECVTDALIERRFATAENAIEMANPLSELQTHLRLALKTSLLQVAAKNLARGVAQLRLFEVGRVYEKRDLSTHEPLRLGLLVAGLGQDAAWYQGERASDYFDLAGTLQLLFKNAGINDTAILESAQVTPAELKIHGIKTSVFYAEIALDDWLAQAPQPERYIPVPAFPPSRRDVAIVLPKSVPQAKVEEVIRQAKAPNLESIRLFDLFCDVKGEKIPADHKSLAYALTYRAPDRTLTEKEVNDAHALIHKKLATDLDCTFRE